MDWFSWLSKASLDPSLVYEYGLVFAQNELEQEDIVYFNHEFLQSMGISIAKHRLEILKLANKEKKTRRSSHPVSRIINGAIKKTKNCLSNYIHSLTIHRSEKSALVVVPTRPSDQETRWKSFMVKRSRSNNKKLIVNNGTNYYKQEKLLLTSGNSVVVPTISVLDGFSVSSPKVKSFQKEMKMAEEEKDDDNGYWSAALEEIRWDAMFQDLKPN